MKSSENEDIYPSPDEALSMKNIRRELYSAEGKGTKKLVREQASRYGRSILEGGELSAGGGIPESNFDLLMEIISTKTLYLKPGIDEFILTTVADSCWLSDAQKVKLYDAMFENYQDYVGEEFCWLICDFIARSFNAEKSVHFFESKFSKSTKDGKQAIYLGLDILVRSVADDPKIMQRVGSVLREAHSTD